MYAYAVYEVDLHTVHTEPGSTGHRPVAWAHATSFIGPGFSKPWIAVGSCSQLCSTTSMLEYRHCMCSPPRWTEISNQCCQWLGPAIEPEEYGWTMIFRATKFGLTVLINNTWLHHNLNVAIDKSPTGNSHLLRNALHKIMNNGCTRSCMFAGA